MCILLHSRWVLAAGTNVPCVCGNDLIAIQPFNDERALGTSLVELLVLDLLSLSPLSPFHTQSFNYYPQDATIPEAVLPAAATYTPPPKSQAP
jgi:hypothetical protein